MRLLAPTLSLTLLLLSSITAFSQDQQLFLKHNEIAQLAKDYEFDIFKENSARSTDQYVDFVNESQILEIDSKQIAAIKKASPDLLTIPIRASNNTEVLKFYKADVFADGYQRLTSTGDTTGINEKLLFYRGYVQGSTKSIAAMSIVNDDIRIIYSSGLGNTVINKVGNDYVLYNDQQLKGSMDIQCGTTELYNKVSAGDLSNAKIMSRSTGGCVEVYIEADNQSYIDNGSNVANTEAWVAALFNEVATLYANESISVTLSSVKVWDTIDPYANSSSTGKMLTDFGDQVQNNYQGRLAHVVTTRSLGGGVAWVNVLCNNYNANSSSGPYAVSASLSTNIVPFPTYSWNITVFAHEMGHNFGSSHTHDCVWNGNNTQIDDCGSIAGYGGGACYDPTNPIQPAANQGTLMSYCHLGGNLGIGFNQGFGTQPGDVLRANFNGASCNTGCSAGATCNDGIQNGDEDGIDCGGSTCPNCPPLANDDCSGATDISSIINGGASTYSNANTTATAGSKGPSTGNYTGCNTFLSWCNNTVHNDVWYKFTIPAGSTQTGFVKISTQGSTFDTQLALWESCTGNLLSANDDYWGSSSNYQSLLTATVNVGQTYYIQVDGWSNQNSGDIRLDIEYTPLTGATSYGSATTNADWEARDINGWTNYVNSVDGTVLLTVNKNGNNLGWLGINSSFTCENKSNTGVSDLGIAGCNAPYSSNIHWWIMNRTWNLNPQTQPSSNVQVRSYYTTTEFNLITNANPDIIQHTDLTHYKTGSEEDLTVAGNECHQMVDPNDYIEYVGQNNDYTYGTFENDHYAQYSISSFSGGGGGGGAQAGGALPIVLLDISVKEVGYANRLDWSTASEVNNDYQSIQKSYDGQTGWIEVGRVAGTNQESGISNYTLLDKQPFGLTYYRLRSVDYDHREEYSGIIQLKRKDASIISRVYPNPTSEILNLEVESLQAESMSYEVYDMAGKLLISKKVQNQKGMNNYQINVRHLPLGVYQLLVKRNDVAEIMRITRT